MDYRVVDMEAYPRKEHFAYFRSLAFPYVGVTRNVDITAFLRRCKAQGHNFFLRFLYEVAAAANAVPACGNGSWESRSSSSPAAKPPIR